LSEHGTIRHLNRIGTALMRTMLTTVALLLATGCGPQFQIRKDPDLQHIKPNELGRLKRIRIDPNYHATVSRKSDWQIHTSLEGRAWLADDDWTTVATTERELRKGDWVLIDLGCLCHFQNVRQLHPDGGEPPTYRVDTAGERGFPFTLQFVGPGSAAESVATFPKPIHARFIRVTLLSDAPRPWRVAEFAID
jgi:hypothetical protein